MEELNVNLLVDAKKEYTKQLQNVLRDNIYKGFASIYKEAVEIDKSNSLPIFQDLLKDIPKWNQDIIDKEADRIVADSGCAYLDDLITAVFVSNTKILSSIRVGNNNGKTLDLQIPKRAHFVHHCYIESAREIFKDPYLFDRKMAAQERQMKMRETLNIINHCIEEAVRKMLPVEQIIHQYLTSVYDQETAKKTEKLDVNDEHADSVSELSEDDESASEVESLSESGTESESVTSSEEEKEDEQMNVTVDRINGDAESVKEQFESKPEPVKEEIKSIVIGKELVKNNTPVADDNDKAEERLEKIDQLLEEAKSVDSFKVVTPFKEESKDIQIINPPKAMDTIITKPGANTTDVVTAINTAANSGSDRKKIRYINSRKQEKQRLRKERSLKAESTEPLSFKKTDDVEAPLMEKKEINLDDFESKTDNKFSFFDDAKTAMSDQ